MKLRLNKERALPFSLTAFIIFADQLVKAYIVKNWPSGSFINDVFSNDLLHIYHVRNKAIAFSLGANVPDNIRPILFIILPVLVLCFLLWYYLKAQDLTIIQRWAVAGIVGGGLGNIIDRVFRPEGVVDYVSFRFFGLKTLEGGPLDFLSWDRWPTFNIADASVVVCCLTFLVSIFIIPSRKPAGKKAA